jgi:translation initiation factor IF-2
MSIEDYALELGVDTSLVISKLKELGFKYNNKTDYLDDEAIIMLDNEMGDLSNKENNLTEELADKFEMEDRAEQAALAHNIEVFDEVKVKEKIKRKDSNKIQKDEDLSLKKKNIYKNKTKLQSNKETQESNVVLYREGMSVSDLAAGIGVSASDLVKKLIGMGLMISSNQAISFDDASIVVMDYNKELTREEATDITNFEE